MALSTPKQGDYSSKYKQENRMEDPTRARQRVLVADANDLGNVLPALLNPEQLSMAIGVEIGRLKPVGWSSSIKMYGATGDWAFQLPLYFSQFAIWTRGYKFPGIMDAVNWLSQFVYPTELGRASAPMLIVWPNVLTMEVLLESFQVTHSQFDKDLNVRVSTVELNLVQKHVGFIDSMRHGENGLEGFGETWLYKGGILESMQWPSSSGTPLNLGRGKP